MHIDKEYLTKLIHKLQESTATDDEITFLTNFYNYCQRTNDWPAEIPNKEIVLKGILSKIENRISSSNKKEVRIKYLQFSKVLKYAAIAILFLGIGYFYQYGFFANDIEINSPSESITLQLENGNVEIINEDGSSKIVNAQGTVVGTRNGAHLVYNSDNNLDTLVYNTLIVPYGKQSKVHLSDGTIVNLNAGTSFRYPVNFIKGHDRNVFLTGEAYFDVAKDQNHPFVVAIGNLNVQVLGTAFNVSHYPNDPNTSTVLVEGSVELYLKKEGGEKENVTQLKPGYLAEWNKESETISLENVDTKIYTAWIQGELLFRNTTFFKIRQVLERKYNVKIRNRNSDLDNQLFDATFDIESIEDILESFSKSYPIKYKIKNNEIIIE